MSENGKKKLIYAFIGFGCGIALSGIMMLVIILNTKEYQQGLINYISSSNEKKDDIGQINTSHSNNNEENPVRENQTLEEHIIDNNSSSDSNQQIIQDSLVVEDQSKELENILIYIPKNSTSTKICEILQENGVILDAKDFEDYIKMNNKTKNLKSGEIILPSKGSYEELLRHLVSK